MESVLLSLFHIFLVIFLVLLNGFFVAAEFAIVKVRATRIAQLNSSRGKVAQKILKNLDAYLSATQLGITLASLGLGWVGEPFIARMLEEVFQYIGLPDWVLHTVSFIIAFSIITFLHIVIGEMAPKSLAIRQSESTTLWTAIPLDWFYQIFKPFIYILNGTANLLLKWLGIGLNEGQHVHTEEEIRMLIAQSHKSGVIDKMELTLFDNVFTFTDRVAREVMVPRVNMRCLYENQSLEENLQIIKNSRHTRFPLCGKDKDDIKGIIHLRDVYQRLLEDKPFTLDEIARPTTIVPETMEIKDVLKTIQKNKGEMVIVVDEFGGTSGLITTEDIIEEIVGEIQDEFDNEKPFYQKRGNQYSINGQLLIEDVNRYFQLDIEDENNDTIGGWLFSQLGKVPQLNDEIKYRQWTFVVEELDQFQITRIKVIPAES